RDKNAPDLRIGDQIEIALPVSDFDILQSVPFFRHGKQSLRQEIQMLSMNAQFAGSGAKQITFHANDVAKVEKLVKFIIFFGNAILPDINLKLLPVLRQVREAGLSHAANRLYSSGDAH